MPSKTFERIISPSTRGKLWRTLVVVVIFVILGALLDVAPYYNRAVDALAIKTAQTVSLPHFPVMPFKLGLDLQGGTHLIFNADMKEIAAGDRASAIEGVRDVIERRVNVFGVSEPNIQTSVSGDTYQVIVELAGVKDVNDAIKMIGETPLLEFKEQADKQRELTAEEKKAIDETNKKAEKKAEEVLGKVISGGNFEALAKEYSQDTNTKDNGGDLGWITEKDNPQIVGLAKSLTVGKYTTDIKKISSGYVIAKLDGKRDKTNPFNENEKEKEVKASHILICFKDAEGCTSDLSKEDALKNIDDIKKQANPKNFKDLAKKYSTEPNATQTGGDLGWFEKSAMVEEFANTVFSQKVGTISNAVETKYGYHIIYKEADRNITEYKVRYILMPTMSASDIIGEQKEWKNTELTGKNLKRADVQFNQNDGSPEVGLVFDEEGAKLFSDITERNIGKPVAIFLDGQSINEPTVQTKIPDGKAVISGGSINITEAKLLAQRLNAGALPVPINLVNQQTVGASLGQSSILLSLKSGLLGLLLVALFMILIYRLPGLLAVIALSFYGVFVLAIFKLLGVTLTLSGLAGFIISLGMAVDANVLIFERLKEELRDKRPLNIAIKNAFERAWPSIRDGNSSTLISCAILFYFFTGTIKGFAITLIIGVLVSIFTAINITRVMLQLVSGPWLEKRLWLIGAKKVKQ